MFVIFPFSFSKVTHTEIMKEKNSNLDESEQLNLMTSEQKKTEIFVRKENLANLI